ncbi:glycosyltransferase [Limosilactobacillus reuteri subsp. suis]|uniref:glycosyltransferase n=1 Tax=Limosilactobacillus reuteri TaxID=1598 RepID=UPI0039966132
MRIVVNDVAATPDAGGVYSILTDLYNQVKKKDHENEWIFILSGNYFPDTQNIKIVTRPDLKKNKFKKLYFELFNGHKYINDFRPDVYISLQNIATLKVNAKKQVVYLHQPVPFQEEKHFSFWKKEERKLAFYQYIVGFIIKKSISKVKPVTIVQTKWMKRAVLKNTKLPIHCIIVNHPFVNKSDSKLYRNQNYNFFYPASGYLYKNQKLIEQATEILNKKGIKKFKINLTLKNNKENKGENFNYLGHIPREKVLKMYENNVLLFPSYIESFGLPLVEAALKADIILAADTEFAREILNQYQNVYFYKYTDAKKLADLMEKVIKKKIVSNGVPLSDNNNGMQILDSVNEAIDDR